MRKKRTTLLDEAVKAFKFDTKHIPAEKVPELRYWLINQLYNGACAIMFGLMDEKECKVLQEQLMLSGKQERPCNYCWNTILVDKK